MPNVARPPDRRSSPDIKLPNRIVVVGWPSTPACDLRRALRAGRDQRRQLRAFAPPHQEFDAAPDVARLHAATAAAAAAVVADESLRPGISSAGLSRPGRHAANLPATTRTATGSGRARVNPRDGSAASQAAAITSSIRLEFHGPRPRLDRNASGGTPSLAAVHRRPMSAEIHRTQGSTVRTGKSSNVRLLRQTLPKLPRGATQVIHGAGIAGSGTAASSGSNSTAIRQDALRKLRLR